jgi:hypothetical protein
MQRSTINFVPLSQFVPFSETDMNSLSDDPFLAPLADYEKILPSEENLEFREDRVSPIPTRRSTLNTEPELSNSPELNNSLENIPHFVPFSETEINNPLDHPFLARLGEHENILSYTSPRSEENYISMAPMALTQNLREEIENPIFNETKSNLPYGYSMLPEESDLTFSLQEQQNDNSIEEIEEDDEIQLLSSTNHKNHSESSFFFDYTSYLKDMDEEDDEDKENNIDQIFNPGKIPDLDAERIQPISPRSSAHIMQRLQIPLNTPIKLLSPEKSTASSRMVSTTKPPKHFIIDLEDDEPRKEDFSLTTMPATQAILNEIDNIDILRNNGIK